MNRIRNFPWLVLPAWLFKKRLRILMYHSIADNPRDPHAISPAEFRIHMQALRSKLVVSLGEALEYLRDNRSLLNVYVLTFDDALFDFYSNAMPVLQEFGYPVTMFVPTGLVGGNAVWDSYDKSKPLMTWKQMEECQKYKVVFGSHTVNHVRLTECTADEIMDELCISLGMLREHFENVIPALAYPGGYHNAHIRDAVQAADYACALGASSRWGNGPESDLFQLRRERFH
jgi:peptidoglycan/xylan/chitin deacetylase (PgdA/CDA1 family)